ncbi:MAG TPA: CocE/NonD family hydrolase [Candidatus Acidoferrales bacterium]|nr:CocE/NonD family hydrolase [Candidatus Acidoferrales bacterium]
MKKMRIAGRVCACAAILVLAAFAGWREVRVAHAQSANTLEASQVFTKQDVMIPTRDGVKLHTEIYTPKNASGPLPFMITRTPYGLNDDASGYSQLLHLYTDMWPDGYIFVMQDIRGRYGSEGQFVMQRPPRDRANPKSIDEGTDTYDTIDWLVKNIPNNNGRAGLAGISYGGWLTAMALLEPHPALKAVSEQASPADMFLGDDFHHNGAFRLSYGFEYAAEMETGKTNVLFHFDDYDTFEWYLKLGPLSNVDAKYLHGRIPTWEDYVNHPNYDSFWQKQAFPRYLKDLHLSVPNLNVAGWWDQEDFYGPVKIYELLEPHDTQHFNYLIVGPWNHGGWARSDGESLGQIKFGKPTSKEFRADVQAKWFAYWLKDEGQLPFKKVRTFETGSNKWMDFSAWPPTSGVEQKKLYFHSNGKLSFDAPEENTASAFDSYISDPAHPVPYRHRPIEETYGPGSRWSTWLVEDQRFVDNRPDTVTWSTGALDRNVCVAGDIVAHLYASTTGSDSDWIAKLIDVYPENYTPEPTMSGFELMIANDVFRGRFRNSFERPEPITPGKVTPYTIDLHTNSHCFLKGHRIMVQVQSTWFPIIDRNPQKYVPNIFKAVASDYIKATQRIYRSNEYPSNVEISVVQR